MSEWMLLTVLVVTGLALIAVDFYLPGFILGSIGVVLLIVSLFVCQSHHGLNATIGLGVLELVFAVVAGYVSIKYFPHTTTGKKMILSAEQLGGHTALHSRTDLIGREGVAHTMLRPAGTAIIDGKRLDVAAESGMIERGTAIRVVDIKDNQIFVRKV